jgi:hypothetical protein
MNKLMGRCYQKTETEEHSRSVQTVIEMGNARVVISVGATRQAKEPWPEPRCAFPSGLYLTNRQNVTIHHVICELFQEYDRQFNSKCWCMWNIRLDCRANNSDLTEGDAVRGCLEANEEAVAKGWTHRYEPRLVASLIPPTEL